MCGCGKKHYFLKHFSEKDKNMIVEQESPLAPDTSTVGHRPAPLRLSEIFEAAVKHSGDVPERLLTYNRGMQSYHAYSGELTLVLGRSVRRSAEIAGTVALFLAQKYPDRNVLLFNTYASADLLTAGFARALYYLGMKSPTSFERYLPKVTKDNFDDSVDLPSPENLRIVDCPASLLTPESLELEIVRNNASIILVNSLEFAAYSDLRKKELAGSLLDLRHRLGLSAFVFSHELRPILPYSGGRGALGMLSAYAKSIWHIVEDWEHRSWASRLMDEEIKELL
jgi:hypothetical protein